MKVNRKTEGKIPVEGKSRKALSFSMYTFQRKKWRILLGGRIYLKPFEMSVKAGNITLNYVEKTGEGVYENKSREFPAAQAIMTAFNRIGYTWTGGHYPLITGVLRNEWGFKGFVITDNANTGVFMDAYQMIEAGADGKLTSIPGSARYNFDVSVTTVIWYNVRKRINRRIQYDPYCRRR